MQEKTDDEHSLTLQQIMHELEANDISAERKSLYDDFKCMEEHLGIEVIKEQKSLGKVSTYLITSIWASTWLRISLCSTEIGEEFTLNFLMIR